ncbi:heme oxygenase-like protein [Cutaneotrichosporon oleaginosum]|uniref:Heme oxygenase-like protein n=1 Tax=Cutaneotrichosporon oleaginosum TaxID=879819 RepID=A0A0J0XRW3_9TREE|nr:heme oxygenase-like protein [Cutaneotrichosporon oleaginosum]KLT43843.1 heme oxygenase-like protein [Cutaneotrichosporon oleaginosum]TXT06417.1 hypothetical protein COLE_05748 [Cutaneotrichosporon oleaginosum]
MSTATAPHASANGLKSRANGASNGAASPAEGVETPGFAPNAPPSVLPSSRVTLQSLLYESGAGDGVSGSVDDWPLPDDLDFERPVSELLRKGTQRAHTNAENSDGATALTAGKLEMREYVRWLGLLWRVYDALESGLDAHATNPVLAPTYNPKLLARAPTLAADIRFLLQRMGHDDAPPRPDIVPTPPFPLPAFLAEVFTTTAAPLKVYLDRLREISATPAQAPRLLAHAYVRYLGDLSGGQIIGARLRKAYNLDTLDGRRFYFFDLDGDASAAETGDETVGDRKKKLFAVKGWYRDGMDGGVGDAKALKASLVKEANLAFILNTHLFSLITPPPKPEPRYYDKLAARAAAEAPKPKSLAEHLITLAYVIASVLLGMALFHVAWPTARPHVLRVSAPLWEQYGAPWFHGTFAPWWNDSVVPWWDHHAAPLFARQLANSRRALL